MNVAIAADHGGHELKQHVAQWLTEHGHTPADFGPDNPGAVDYPDYAFAVSEAVAKGEADVGVLCCTTGIGMSIAANKVPGIRAALVFDAEFAAMSRAHNNANVLCLPGQRMGLEEVEKALEIWLSTEFEGGRHARRVAKITAKERECLE